MKKTANNITATVNGIVFKGLTIEQAQALASIGFANANDDKPEKPESKPENVKNRKQAKREKHERAKRYINVRKDVERDANNAIKRAADKFDIALKLETLESYCTTKDGKCEWAWLRCTDDKLNHDNGKDVAAALPKVKVTDANGKTHLEQVWKYSPRRNAIYRAYGKNITC